ncbi:MAG: NAD-dependent epimerase/dehydratase family protein [Halobacteriales archaeon]|nr:NAD-dependent epimerase/dehydratase family protein [Halobacteriales archaeon]
MDVFVTGGSGFIGTHLLERLEEEESVGDVRALARSDESARTVEACGATAVRGDLGDVEAMSSGMEGCDTVFHLAAKADRWGAREEFVEVNVRGTENAVEAAREAGVDTLVHTSTEAVLSDGSPLRDVDETEPYPENPVGLYPETKGEAERYVLDANDEELTTVAVRPRFVWGPRDETLLPEFVEAIESGRYFWFDGGRYPTSTSHVYNVVEGHLLAAENGDGGEAYFVADDGTVEFREFITELVRTRGVEPPDRSVPSWFAKPTASVLGTVWRALGRSSPPPLDKVTLAIIGHEVTVDDTKAREELGYEPVVTREEGLEELRNCDSKEFAVV